MKNSVKVALIILFFNVCVTVSAKTYFVAPTGGSDSNPGTLGLPWATWQKAFTTADAGDTVYFRGGIWYPTEMIRHWPQSGYGHIGTHDNPICFFNYPGESPILDCSKHNMDVQTDAGISFSGSGVDNSGYIKVRGLTVRNLRQRYVPHEDTEHYPNGYPQYIVGIEASGTNIYFENCTSHHIGGYGFQWLGYDTLYALNCDAYYCIDSLTMQPAPLYTPTPGNKADGFGGGSGGTFSDTNKVAYYEGCRAWKISDDGFDFGSTKQLHVSNCWVWDCGYLEDGHGSGFKFNQSHVAAKGKRIIYNCISAYNTEGIINTNLLTSPANLVAYNNTIYGCDYATLTTIANYSCEQFKTSFGWSSKTDFLNNVAFNCKSYGPMRFCDMEFVNNTWNIKVDYPYWEYNTDYNVSGDDFMSLDTAQLRYPRQADGSLPAITFMKLKEGSDLIDRGTNVGLSFRGTAPDLGYSEYESGSVAILSPTFINALIQNTSPAKLEMNYNLPLANVVPSTSAFSVQVNSLTRTISSVAVSGTKVTLTLASPVYYRDVVTVAYTKPLANPIQSPEGGQAETLAARDVTNNVAAPVPVYSSAVIQNATPTKLEMTYSLSLASIVPATTAFTVNVNTVTRAVNSVAVAGTKVTLTLPSPVVCGDAVTVAYTKPLSNPLQTSDGGQAATISSQNVINNCSETANQPPVVNISSPTKNYAFYAPATITIDAIASDPDGTVTKVEFYTGQTKLGEVTSAPYSFTWKNVSEGTYLISVVATDDKNARTVSTSVTILVEKDAPVVNQLPFVTIKNPNKGEKFKKNEPIILEAEASDPDGTISKIEFKSGDVILAEITEAPYIFNWQNADTGNYIITAIATDNLGAVSQSFEVDFTVFEVKVPAFSILSLYPNPSDGQFTVEMAEAIDNERLYTVYSLSGEAAHQEKRDGQVVTAEFNLNQLPAGTYILAVSSEGKIIDAIKFIKR